MHPADMKRRRAVMARSQKLGHCVCDTKKSCPCETFKEFNVCTCAGERLPARADKISLMRHVRKAGCASKIGQADLKRILSHLPPIDDPRIILGAAAGDDAGVYAIDDTTCLVQTVDVFTPCVDDPYLFGKIAAANSLSDIYAMGGRPLTALSIIGFPIDDLDGSVMEEILCGGIEKLNEAQCSLIGGHSINDEEIKCGFAITGLIDRGHIIPRDAPRAGDALILTKPLGTGILAFAVQIGRASPAVMEDAGAFMAALNRDAAALMVKYNAHAATDVTGFALMGHLLEMVRGGGVSAEIDMSRIPILLAARRCLEEELLPGAIERNQEYASAWVRILDERHPENLPILYDPQTSGGLLIALPPTAAEAYIEEMYALGHEGVSIIGSIIKKSGAEGEVIIVNSELSNFVGNPEKGEAEKPCCCSSASSPAEEGDPQVSEKNPPVETQQLFADFMKEANREGLIDARSKRLMAIALSIARSCRLCLTLHIKGALQMGISREEIDEAAWLAIAFCGSPAMMFYKEVCQELNIQ